VQFDCDNRADKPATPTRVRVVHNLETIKHLIARFRPCIG
jgi:hypothetical protein